MKANLISAAVSVLVTAVAASWAPAAQADDGPPRKPGDHPAVVVQRLHKTAGYDYAAKFYPHPAWLYLHAEPPGDAAGVAQAAAGITPDTRVQQTPAGRIARAALKATD